MKYSRIILVCLCCIKLSGFQVDVYWRGAFITKKSKSGKQIMFYYINFKGVYWRGVFIRKRHLIANSHFQVGHLLQWTFIRSFRELLPMTSQEQESVTLIIKISMHSTQAQSVGNNWAWK